MKKFSWYTNPLKVTDYLVVYQYAVDREILIEKRKDAKTNKDFALADSIRDELLSKGIALKDTREGTTYEVIK